MAIQELTKPTQTVSNALQVDAVRKCWRGAARPVLDDVSLDLASGQLALLSGRNGVGKTTLVRLVAGLLAPDRGAVRIHGISARDDRRGFFGRLGLVSAGDRGLYARLTVRRHLDYWWRLALLPETRRSARIESVVRDFELADLLEARVDRISMGQRQRVRLALSVLHAPSLLLLDEPASSLDDHGVELLRRAVARFLATGGACLWVSPEPETLDLPATELVLSDGRLSIA